MVCYSHWTICFNTFLSYKLELYQIPYQCSNRRCFPGIMLGKKCPQAFSVYILHPTTLWPWTQYFIPLNFTFLLQNKVIVCATRMLSPSLMPSYGWCFLSSPLCLLVVWSRSRWIPGRPACLLVVAPFSTLTVVLPSTDNSYTFFYA